MNTNHSTKKFNACNWCMCFRWISLIGLLIFACLPQAQGQDESGFNIIRIQTKTGGPYVGELTNEGNDAIELFDFQMNRLVTVKRDLISRIENPITIDEAAKYAGVPAVMGRMISQLSVRKRPAGKIAKVTPQVVYLTLGESSGVVVGEKVTVFRGEGDVIDPDTGKVLASERARIAEVSITEVNENISKAKLLGDLEIKLEVGDEVEPQDSKIVVAVCPPSNEDGSSNPTGVTLAEALTSALVQRKVSVVERSALNMVLAELIAQNTVLFDQGSAQQLGKLTGASMVLTGKITGEKNSGTAHIRLIEVKTGEILIALSAPVKISGGALSSASRSSSRSPTTSKRTESTEPSGKLEFLGKSRSLPKYLTTTGSVERTPDGGIRIPHEKPHYEYEGGLIITRDRNLLDRDFVFEVLVTFGPNDGIGHVGIGTGRQDGAANRRADSIFIRFHPPSLGDGEVNLESAGKPSVKMGNVPQGGVHMVRITKEGDALTIEVDPENDGPTDDDLETTIPDLRAHAPYLNSKNCSIFLGGRATFVSSRMEFKSK